MGGKALSIQTERIGIEKYEEISNDILNYFSYKFTDRYCHFRIPYHVTNKESFGDLDVIMSYEESDKNLNIKKDVKEFITSTFKPQSLVVNHNVISFDYKNFQIDIIIVPEKHAQSTFTYMCYGDASNIIGRIANRFGFKYGMDGFYFKYKGYEKLLHKNLVTAMPILGFNPNHFFSKGFESNEDLFEFIRSSKYFDPYIFKSNNDDMKRSTYSQFLEYVKGLDFEMPYFRFRKNPEEYIGLVGTWYPEIIEFTFEIDDMLEERRMVAEKFNGDLIMVRYTELYGARLGQVIKAFHQYIANTSFRSFNEYIINTEYDKIWEDFHNVYQKFLVETYKESNG